MGIHWMEHAGVVTKYVSLLMCVSARQRIFKTCFSRSGSTRTCLLINTDYSAFLEIGVSRSNCDCSFLLSTVARQTTVAMMLTLSQSLATVEQEQQASFNDKMKNSTQKSTSQKQNGNK